MIFSILLFVKIVSFPLFPLNWFDFYLYLSIHLCFEGMRIFQNNLHFNLGDSLMFDSFIQQHLFHMKPNNSYTISKIRLGPQKHLKSKGKYPAALVGVWKYTAIGILGLGTCHAINREIRDPKVGGREEILLESFWGKEEVRQRRNFTEQ